MGNYEQLKQSVSNVIKTNGNQEITGSILQNVLLTIISTVGANATFAGIATPATNPGTPDGPVFYLASEGGTYTNFNAIELQDGLSVLMWNGSWSSQQILSIDDEPTAGSDNLVKSGGVFNNIGALDISELNATENPHTLATYEDLSSALNTLPASYRNGGMTVKFVQSSGNKYVQYRLMANAFTTDSSQWQGVDEKPVKDSNDLVESGGVEKYIRHILPVEHDSLSEEDSVVFINNEEEEVFRVSEKGPIVKELLIEDNNEVSSFNKEYFDKSKEVTKQYLTSEEPVEQSSAPKDSFEIATEDGIVKFLVNPKGVFLDGNEDVPVLPNNYGGDKEFFNYCTFFYTKYNKRFIRINNTYNLFYSPDYGELIKNPLISINFPDASWTKGGDGYYYICATDFPMYIYKSNDFVNWIKCGQVFADDDPWNTNDWAPSINYINNKYYVYSISNFEVQLRVSNTPEGPYTLIKESMIVGGAVDPQYVEGGYLVYNNNSGVVLQKLNNDLDTLIGDPIVLVHPTDRNEGSYIFHYGNYYYLFTSAPYSNTVDYNVKIYRSPILEAANWEYGGVLMGSENGDFLYGPGHVGEILETEDNRMFIPMQICIKGLSPEYGSSNAPYRPTILQELRYNSDSKWFEFIDINGNVITKPSLLVKKPNV